MSCNSCKSKTIGINTNLNKSKINILLRIVYFLVGVVAIILIVPIITVVGIYMLFNTIVLDKSTEIMPSLTYLGKLLRKKNSDSDDEFIDDDNLDDYELLNVEEIKN